VQYGVLVSILLAGGSILMQRKIRTAAAVPSSLSFRRFRQESNPYLLRLLMSDILIRLCERIPFAWVAFICFGLTLRAVMTGLGT